MTIFTRVYQLSLSWTRSILSTSLRCISYRSIVILFYQLHLGLPNDLLQVSTKTLCVTLVPHICCMPHASHSYALGDLSNIWWELKILELLIVHFPSVPCYLFLLRFTYLFSTLFLNTFSLHSSLNERPSFTTYGIVVLCVLICIWVASVFCTIFVSWKHVRVKYVIVKK